MGWRRSDFGGILQEPIPVVGSYRRCIR